jgi:hypothetical protein
MVNYELPSSLLLQQTAFWSLRTGYLLCAADCRRKPRVAQVPPPGLPIGDRQLKIDEIENRQSKIINPAGPVALQKQ